jgi:hypothetical protein
MMSGSGSGDRRSPGARETLRLILPSFVVSVVLVVIGIVLINDHHRGIGLVLVVIGAAGGFLVRMRLMLRARR